MSLSSSSTPETYFEDPKPTNVLTVCTNQRKSRKRDQVPKEARDSAAPKNCVICGGRTKHYHYEVASCYSCKSFFRRSAVKRVNFTCKKDGKCEVLAGAKCRSCRFDRCILSGMNIESIQLTDPKLTLQIQDDLQQRRAALLRRWKPQGANALLASDHSLEARLLEDLMYTESKNRRMRESLYDPSVHSLSSIYDLLRRHSELRDADMYEKPSNWPLGMAEIEATFRTNGYLLNSFPGAHTPTVDLILSIEAAKTLPVFRSLDLEDQETLLRHVALANSVLTRAFYSYAQGAPMITHPNGLQPFALRCKFPSAIMHVPLGLEEENHLHPIEAIRRVGMNAEEFVLLKAIVYCIQVPYLSDRARPLLAAESTKYSKALLRLLQRRLGEAAGAKKFADLILLIDAFIHFAQRYRELRAICLAFGPFRKGNGILDWATLD